MAIWYITMAAFHRMTARAVYNGGPGAGAAGGRAVKQSRMGHSKR